MDSGSSPPKHQRNEIFIFDSLLLCSFIDNSCNCETFFSGFTVNFFTPDVICARNAGSFKSCWNLICFYIFKDVLVERNGVLE